MVGGFVFDNRIFPACGDNATYENSRRQRNAAWQTKEKMVGKKAAGLSTEKGFKL